MHASIYILGPSARTVIMEDIFDDQIERDKHKIDNSFDLKYLQVSDKFDRAALHQEKRFQIKEVNKIFTYF